MSDASGGRAFADLITDGRHRKGMSQEDLEIASRVSRSTISRWERGLADRPDPRHVRAVCATLGIDPRRAAMCLGYLTEEEIAPITPTRRDESVEKALSILEDPSVTQDVKDAWIDYLRYLKDRQSRNPHSRAAG